VKFNLYVGEPYPYYDTPIKDMTNYASTNLVSDSLDGTLTLGSTIDSLSFELQDPDSDLEIHEGYEVILDEVDTPSNRFFGGIIQSIDYQQVGLGRVIRVTAQDWTTILDQTTIKKIYDQGGQRGQAIIKDAFLQAMEEVKDINEGEARVPEFNTSEFVQDDRVIGALSFQGTTLSSVINTIASISGFLWYIDPFKNLHYFPKPNPREEDKRAAFQEGKHYSDTSDGTTTFPYYGLGIQKEMANWNAVALKGGRGLTDNRLDLYEGDGSEKEYILGSQDGTMPIHYPPLESGGNSADYVLVELNTGSQGSPTWTTLTVSSEAAGGAASDVTWNPNTRVLTFDTAPLDGSNGFRVTGRYFTPLETHIVDSTSITKHSRIFRTSLAVPDIVTRDEAVDLAMAYIRENTDRISFTFTSNADQIMPGTIIKLTNTTAGFVGHEGWIDRVSFRIIGGETMEYRASGQMIKNNIYRVLKK
jgi:hypothetical protein